MFVRQNHNPLFNLLGLGYGQIVFEGHEPINLCITEVGDHLLKEAVEASLISEEDATQIKQQMTDINMAANLGQFINVIREYKVDEGFQPSFKFVKHDDCPDPAAHGVITIKDGDVISNPIFSLADGMNIVLTMAVDIENVLDCVNLFKEMITAGLPEHEEADARLDAVLDMFADMLDGLNITIVEIPLPRRAADKPSDNTGMPGQPPNNQQA